MPRVRFTWPVANTAIGTERDCSHAEADVLLRAGIVELISETSPADPEPTREEIRAWAQENDIECSSKGNLSKSVIQAYQDAHKEG